MHTIPTLPTTLHLANGCEIELCTRDGAFLGLGEVRLGDVRLRAGDRPMFVDIRTPWGVALSDYTLTGQAAATDGSGATTLSFAMAQHDTGIMDWQLHECRPMRTTLDWSRGPQPAIGTSLTLTITPLERMIGKHQALGFSYQYHYQSATLPIYMLLDRGTWELDGSARASEFWMRNGNAPPIYRAHSIAEHYSTEWYLPTCTNPNIFQFLPLQTHLQGFTMTAGDAGTLFTWSPAAYHLRTLIEKPRDTDLLVHMHEHCGDLGLEFVSAPMEVLFAPGATTWVDRANLHGDMAELVSHTLHAAAGIAREYMPTYGQIEEWTPADLELYRREGLPALAEAGISYIELANHFQNNMNTWGVSNMCCTVDHKVAESVGEDKLRAFCQDAAARGVRVGMWGNTAISTMTHRLAKRNGGATATGAGRDPNGGRIDFLPHEGSIMHALEKAKRPFIINSFGAIEADHYTPEFCALNLREPVVREYWRRSWGHLHDSVGMGGIFLDSSFNMSSDKFDWRNHADPSAKRGATVDQTHLLGHNRPATPIPATIESQYHAHLDLVGEMQRMGYLYCGEDSGVFGLHRNGPSLEARLDNLPMWCDFVTEFEAPMLRRRGIDLAAMFFKGLAYRLMWRLCWLPPQRCLSFHYGNVRNDDDRPTAWHVALYRAYSAVVPWMRQRTILPDEAGVLYRHEGVQILWAFTDGVQTLTSPSDVVDVLGTTTPIRGVTELRMQRNHLYRLTSSTNPVQGGNDQ